MSLFDHLRVRRTRLTQHPAIGESRNILSGYLEIRATQIEAGGNSLRWAVVAFWLMCSFTGISAQDVSWERATITGLKAFEQRNYTEAAQQFQTALAVVETIKPDDPRLANSLMRLAVVYHTQGQYAEAEPLYQRALMIQEQMFGPDHPQIVEMLEAYANLLRRMHPFQSFLPWSTANKLAARARQIREREARSGAQDPPGVWSDYEEAAIFRDGGS